MKPFLTKQLPYLTFLKHSAFLVILLSVFTNDAFSQRMTVHIVTSTMATTCTDNFLQGAPDPRWQMEVAGQGYSGCQTGGANNFDIFNGCVPITVQPGGTVPICVRFFEDDAAIGCGGSSRSCEVVVCQNYTVPAASVQSPVYSITGIGASSGTITFYLTYTAIANDNVCNAAAITANNVQVNGNNDCATVETGEVSAGGNVTPTNTIWYQFTAPASGHIRVSTDHGVTNFDTEIALWQQNSGTACTFNTMSYVNDDDDIITLINNNSEFDQECLVPGTRYYLQVDGDAAGETGNVGTTVQDLGGPGPAPNNLVCNAIDLGTVAATATVGNANLSNRANFCATNTGEPNPGWLTNGNDQGVWFKFTTNANPSAQTQIVAHSDPQGLGDAISLQLALYKVTNATPCSATPTFTEIDRAYNPLNNDEEIRADCLEPNTTYYILVDGYQDPLGILGGVQGYFGLAVTDGNLQRGGDQICDALDLGTVPNNGFVQTAPLSQTNVCATDTNDPTPSRWSSEQGVWYSFIAPPSGSVRVEATSDAVICLTCDAIDLQLAIYSTSNNLCSGTVNEFQSEYDPIIFDEEMKVRCLTPGQRYWLFVDGGPLSQSGIFGLQIYDDQSWPAPNDEACNAIALGAPTVGNPVQATNQNNYCADNVLEPIPQQFGNEHSVWYTFVAPPSGTVEITATNIGALCPLPPCADAIQLQVAVFDRATNPCSPANAFTEMPGTNDIFNLPLNSKYTVPCLTPGHIYYVLVDGQGNVLSNEFAFGRFDIEINDTGQQPAGTNDLICNAIALGNPNSAPVGTTQQVGQAGHSQNNYCATHTNEPDAAGVDEDQTVWYSFVAPSTTNVSISITTDNPLCLSSGCDWMWVQAAVFASSDNTCNGVLSQMNTDAGIINIPPDWNAEVPCLIPGNTYFVMVNGGNINNQGHFDIQITAIAPRPFPPNDEPCNATALGNVFVPGGVTLNNETNLCADDPNDPQPSAFGTDHTVWYSFTTPNTASSYAVRVYAESTTINPLALACIDPQIAVFGSNNGTCVKSTFYEVESDYDPVDFPLFSETADIQCLEPNKTYYIMIDGSANVLAEGNFDLHVEEITATPIATNNLACQAINLGTLNPNGTIGNMSTTYSNFCADTESNEPSSFVTGIDQTVWFTFTTPNGGANMTYDATVHVNSDPNGVGDNIDIQAAVYRGTCTALGGMQILKDADPLFSGNADVELHCLDANTTYYIQVDGSNFNVEGYFGITVQGTGSGPRPNNDNRCNAVALGTIPVNGTLNNGVVYNNYCATTEAGEADPSAFNIEKTVWFSFVAPASGNVTLNALSDPTNLGDEIDLEVAIYQAPNGCSGGMVEINSNHDGAGFSHDEDMSVTCLYAGETYYIQVDGSRDLGEDAQGYFTLSLHDDGGVSNHPYNDMVCNAYSFGLATATQQIRSNETNVCATVQLGEPGLGGYADQTVWYSFIAPPSGRVDIDVHSISSFLVTGMDSEVHLVSSSNNTCTGTLNEIASSYFPSSAIDEHIDADCLVPGNTYFIQVDGAGLIIEGNFDIKLKDALPNYSTAQPTNNEPCNPTVLTVQATACFGGGSNASTENYGQPTVSMPAACNASSNCGDTWYSFTMPSTGIVNVRGEDDNVGGGVIGDFSNLHINAYRGVCGSLVPTGNCASGGQGVPNDPDPNFELTGTPGETIWLQVFGDGDNDFGENFQICVSIRCGADNCANAVNMIPGVQYCWSTVGQSGENVGGPNSGYRECTDQTDPEHSVYFKFHSDCNGDSLTLSLIGATIGGSCILGNSPTDGFSMSLFEDSSPCDGNPTRQVDCQSFDVCQHASAFNWSYTYTGLTPNTEYILMIDGGVPVFGGGNDFGEIMITTRGNPQINIVTTGIVCSGGTATATAHALGGGARPFTFNWTRPNGTTVSTGTDSTLTNLTAGIYTCTATDARGCTSTSSTNIVDNTTPIVPTVAQDAQTLCANSADGVATASATGGAGNYTFSWDSGSTTATATNLNVGTHTVTITDASNCSKTATVAITGPSPIVLITAEVQPVSCTSGTDGQANVVASGGTMPAGSVYTYIWDIGGNAATTTASLNAGTHTVTVTDANNCSTTATVVITEPVALTATVVQNTGVLCTGQSNGNATATGIAGNGGYSFLWDNGVATATATNLNAGTHTVIITDSKNCSTIASVTITEPTALSVSAVEDHPTLCIGACNGQSTATGSGGTTPYSFGWDSGSTTATANNLCVGAHQVTVTDGNGCTAVTSINTTEPQPLANAMTIDIQVLCNGACTGVVSAAPSGGTAPYTFLWSDASSQTTAQATNLCATTYTVTITDANSCTKTASITLFSPTAITASASAGNDAHCGQANGSASANANGGTPPYSYLWDNGEPTQTAIALTTGSHTVQITDANNCTKIATVTVGNAAALVATIPTNNSPTCNGSCNGSLVSVITPLIGGESYLWSDALAQTTANATGLCATTYTVTITDAFGCTATASATLTEPVPLSVAVSNLININCHNGTDGSATATATGGTGPIYNFNWGNGETGVTAINLNVGTHTVTVTDSNNCTSTASFDLTEPSELLLTVTLTNDVRCANNSDGAAVASASGGTNTSYTYLWDNGGNNSVNSTLTAGVHSVTVTDANGCSKTGTILIGSAPPLQVIIVQNQGISCHGGNDGIIEAQATGGTSPYTFLWNDIVNTAIHTPTNTSIYTVTVTDANNCTKTASFQMTEPTGITATIQVTGASLCGQATGSATVSVTGGVGTITYNWDNSVQSATNNSLAAGAHFVTVTDGNGCTTLASCQISQNSTLVATANQTTGVTCQGANNGTALVTITGGTVPYTILWDNGDITPAATALTGGLHTVIVTDAGNCSIIAVVTIDEPNVLAVATSLILDAHCGLDNGSAIVNVSGGTQPYTYLWDNTEITATAILLSPGDHVVTVTDAHGCTQTASTTIGSSLPLVATTVLLSTARCNQMNGSAECIGIHGTLPYTYSWDNGVNVAINTTLSAGTHTVTATDATGCTSSSTINIPNASGLSAVLTASTNVSCHGVCNGAATISIRSSQAITLLWSLPGQTDSTVNNLCAGTYTAYISDATGCTTNISVTITEPPVVSLVVTELSPVTCNNNGIATVTAAGGTPPYTYLWDNGTTLATATNLSPGLHTIAVSDALLCQKVASITINSVNLLSAIALQTTGVKCSGGSDATATANVTGGVPPYTYTWDMGGSTSQLGTNLNAGNHTVTVADAAGCSTIANVTITQPSPLTVQFNNIVNAGCNGQFLGSATAAGVQGSTPYTYLWAHGPASASITALQPGLYTVTVTDGNACTASNFLVISDTPPPVIDSIQIRKPICYNAQNGSATIFASSGINPLSYHWNNNVTTELNGNLKAGTYTVTVTDAGGCSTTRSVQLTQPRPIQATTALTSPQCYGESTGSISIENIVDTVGATNYSIDGGTLGTNPIFTNIAPGGHSLLLQDSRGCEWLKTVNIPYGIPLTVDIGSNITLHIGDSSILRTTLNNFASVTYQWSPQPGLSCYTCKYPTAKPLLTTTYTITVTDANGCTATDNITITVEQERDIYIPNTFTPNNDGVNDNFTAFGGAAADKIVIMRIYDRWGELVYEGKDLPLNGNRSRESWNGTFKDQPCNPGVFAYYFEVRFIDGEIRHYSGDVTLTR